MDINRLRNRVSKALEVIKPSIYRHVELLKSGVPNPREYTGVFEGNKVSLHIIDEPGEAVDIVGSEALYTPFAEVLEVDPPHDQLLCRELSKDMVASLETGVVYADSVAVETGTIFLAHPYRYVPLSTHSRRLVVIAGRERLFHRFIDAFKIAYEASTLHSERVNIGAISSPSRTGDIEKRVVYGAHGPRELVLIILDRVDPAPYRLFFSRYVASILGMYGCGDVSRLDPYTAAPYIEGLDDVYRSFFREWGYDIELVGEGLRWRSLEI